MRHSTPDVIDTTRTNGRSSTVQRAMAALVVSFVVTVGVATLVVGGATAAADTPALDFQDQATTGDGVWVEVTENASDGDVLAVWDESDEELYGTVTLTGDEGSVWVAFDDSLESTTTLEATVHDGEPEPDNQAAAKYDGAVDTAEVSVVSDQAAIESGPVSYATAPGSDTIVVETVFAEGDFTNLNADQVTVTDRNDDEDLATDAPTVSGADDQVVRLELETDEPLKPGATLELFDSEHEIDTTAATVDADADRVRALAGETLAIVGEEGELVSVETPDRVVERGLGEDSQVRPFETSNYVPGDELSVTFESGATTTVELVSLGLVLETDAESYQVDETVTATVTADRIDREVEFSLLDSDGEAVDDDRRIDVLNHDGEARAAFDLEGLVSPMTEYGVGVEHVPSGKTAESPPFRIDPDATATLDSDRYVQQTGDVVEFTVDTDGEDRTHVSIDDGSDWELSFWIEDPETDEVDVSFNTYHAGHDDARAVTTDDADIEIDEETSIDDDEHRLADGEYALEVGYWPVDPTDSATLDLEPRATEGIDLHVAPYDAVSTADDADDVLEVATTRSTIAEGDLAVLEVEASGIFGYLLDEDGSWAEGTGLDVVLSPAEDADDESAALSLADGDFGDAAIHPDPDANAVYVVVDQGELAGMAPGDQWEAAFVLTDENPYLDDGAEAERVSTPVDVVERAIELVGDFDGDLLEVANVEESWITAETTVAPGTDVQFDVEIDNRLLSVGSTVDEDGTAAAHFDFSEYEPGEEVQEIAAIEKGGDVETRAAGVIVAPTAEFVLEATADSQVSVDDPADLDVTVTNVGQADGETPYEVEIDDELVDDRELSLDAGENVSETYDFDTAEADEIPWSVTIGESGSESGTVTVTDDGSEGTNGNESDQNGDGDPPDDTSADSEDDGQVGFGVLVAVVALAALATVAAWRQ